MSEPWQVQLFGVRHLSPGGAWHLRRFLDQIQPQLVMIEGLSDAVDLTRHWVKKGTHPPIAILAYTSALPMRTLVYPMARYSPEYQAVLWAHDHRVPIEFIDLPSPIFLGLQEAEQIRFEQRPVGNELLEATGTDSDNEPETVSVYEQWADHCGEGSYDTYWERNFEHNLNHDSYRLAILELGRSLRELDQDPVHRRAECLVREAYMRRCIQRAVDRGIDAKRIVAIVGAFHAPVLNGAFPSMTDEELSQLPVRESKLTLMPYSYFRLSSQSGYGAGNRAPAYFELMWDALQHDTFDRLAGKYLSTIARFVRSHGTHRSTAEVIDGVRLARTLSALHDGHAPTLDDLHDAATSLMGHGDRSSIAESLAHVDVGTAIGSLPAGVSRTSIQDDFDRELLRLKLEKYRSTVKQDLALDLRENRAAKSDATAFIDLARSTFLHRLRTLQVPFSTLGPTNQQSATWAEHWVLQWTPECEIALVESVLLGETIELAAGYKLTTAIEATRSVDEAAGLVRDACVCNLILLMETARRRVQELATENSAATEVAQAAYHLMQVVRFGDVRKFDTLPLVPLIEELFVLGALALHDASNCDAAAARKVVSAIDQLNHVSLEFHDRIDEELWRKRLQLLSDTDDRSPLVSGFACALLLERGWMNNDSLSREVSRRLSPGIPADLGAGWFEGLASRNRYALITRQVLWSHLAAYVAQLDDDTFRRSLVFLRRAFGSFSPQQKRSIVENLAHVWGIQPDAVAEVIDGPLTSTEENAINELNEFDFGDL